MNTKAALVGGIGLGAALMYLFDPDRGRDRREVIRDKAESAANKAGDYAGKMSRDIRNRAYGVVAETKSMFRQEEVTDELLLDRVRSKLGHYPAQAGTIDVTANNGIVSLRGSILAKEVPRVLRAVRFIRGVKSIDNQLELRNEPEGESSLESTPNPFGTQPEPAGGV